MTSGIDLIVGHLDTSIGELLRKDADLLLRFAWILVTSIDSMTDLPAETIGGRVIERHPGCGFLGKGLLIPGVDIAGVAAEFDFFNGFDELWCFGEKPKVEKPPDLSIVAPLDLAADDPPRLLPGWIKESGCLLGLGDGVGLNFATLDIGLARLLTGSE